METWNPPSLADKIPKSYQHTNKHLNQGKAILMLRVNRPDSAHALDLAWGRE